MPVLVADEVPEGAHVPFCWPPEMTREPALPEQIGPPVSHFLYKSYLFWEPGVKRGGSHFGGVYAQGAMHTTAIEAHEYA